MILLYLLISTLIGTIIIELSFALILGIRKGKDILNVVLVNIMTNPFLVIFSFMIKARYGNQLYLITLFILEILAVLLEGFIYERYLEFKRIRPYLLSLILNSLSFMIGLLFSYM